MATARTVTPGQRLMLTLAGVACGFVEAVDGGGIVADVVEEKVGSSPGVTSKAVGSVAYEPLTVDVGFGLAHDVYDWIAATWSGMFTPKECSITTADAQLNAKWEQQCHNARLTGVTLGPVDATSKDVLRLSLEITAERVQDAPASGTVAAAAATVKPKQLLAAHFRLELDGVDCTGVRRIDPFTVQLQVVEDTTGTLREPGLVPAKLAFPNLAITLNDNAAAASWWSWATDFLVNGNSSSAKEKNGAIVFLAPDLKTELARVQLHGVGICGLRHGRRAANAEAVPTLIAELYCEAMTLQLGAPAPAPAQPVRKPGPEPRPIAPVR